MTSGYIYQQELGLNLIFLEEASKRISVVIILDNNVDFILRRIDGNHNQLIRNG